MLYQLHDCGFLHYCIFTKAGLSFLVTPSIFEPNGVRGPVNGVTGAEVGRPDDWRPVGRIFGKPLYSSDVARCAVISS